MRRMVLSTIVLFGAMASCAWAQPFRQPPRVGYVYPAGGCRGETIEVTVGGQYLASECRALISGEGIEATQTDYLRPPTPKEIANIREIFDRAREQVQEDAKAGKRRGPMALMQKFKQLANAEGITDRQIEAFNTYRRQRSDPKVQVNPQLSESIKVRLALSADAEPGTRELRILTSNGISNPIRFLVDGLPEIRESEPNDRMSAATVVRELPVVINGQIMPGDVDRFRFHAVAGQRLVVNVSARDLIPYFADAVPGWFQATAALYDADGREVAYDDDWRFDPDPVLLYKVPRDGDYVLEIADSIYRGREDFVYRVTVGELPFVSSVFPLGARKGSRVDVDVEGQNLPFARTGMDLADAAIGHLPFRVTAKTGASNALPFAVDDLPELTEKEPNGNAAGALKLEMPVIVNGRIDRPDDWDVYRFHARKGAVVVAEVRARRLGSPLDSLLKVTDAEGRVLALNDDHEDKGAGLLTHHADSRLSFAAPQTGDYLMWIGDTQRKGGSAYAYRLRVGPERPDFELRVAPSAISARGGSTVPVTVYALRRDGFSGDIALRLKDEAGGFALSGALVPGNMDKITLTLTVPPGPKDKLTRLRLEGLATVAGEEVRRDAVAADDMEQAFSYRHLVPAENWMVAAEPVRWGGPRWTVNNGQAIRLKPGQTTRVRVSADRRAAARQFQLDLSDPPEGIVLESVTPLFGGFALEIRADAEKVKPGLRGNLIVDVSFEFKLPNQDDEAPARTRRIPQGVLPAIPFEVVDR